MKFRNTGILLLVAAAIAAFIFFYERYQPTSQEATERAARVVQFDRDKMNAITIKNPEATIELRKVNDQWLIESPVKDRADAMAITSLFTAAEGLRAESTFGADKKGVDKEQLKDFGVSSPPTRVKFAGTEKTVELLFGKDTAVEGKLYARLEGDNTVYVIRNDLKNQISKKADEFRDRKLTDVISTQVDRVQIKSQLGEIELQKKDQRWLLAKPLKARGDSQKIGDVIAQTCNAHIDSFVPDAANLGAFGLQEPRGTVTLYVEGRDQPTVLLVGDAVAADKEKIYAKLSTRDSVYVLPKSIESVLQTKPNDVRDKNLVRFEPDIVDRINLEVPGHDKIVLARSGESWVRKGADGNDIPANGAAASRLLSEIHSQQVASFVSDVATELPKYGLDQPQVKLTFSSYASENTAETTAGEKPIVALLFGKAEGADLYAMVEDEPFIVSVPRTLLDVALTDPLQWQELAIFKNKPEEIVALELAREELPTVSLERDKDKTWKLAKGDGVVNQTNAQSAVNTLATLRAVRWIGATTPEHGVGKATLTATFKTASGSAGKLTVGGNTQEDLSYATADGLTGTFAMSRPDLTALQLPLIEKPTSAQPAAGPTEASSPAVREPVSPSSLGGSSSPQDSATAPAPPPAAEAIPNIPTAPAPQ